MADASPKTVEFICTLTDQAFRDRRTWVRDHIAPHIVAIEKTSFGLELIFPNDFEIRSLVEEFANLERQCCGSFLEFTLNDQDGTGQFNLHITGPDEAQQMLVDLKRRLDAKQFP